MNLVHIVDGHDGDRVALMSRGRQMTYDELRERAAGLRGGLASLGVGRGDRVALLCGNGIPFAVTYLAVIGMGAVAVPMNPTIPPREMEAQLQKAGAKVVVAERVALGALTGVERTRLPSWEHFVVAGDGELPPGAIALNELVAMSPEPVVEVEADDLAVLVFTSGTVGTPRAAMLSHSNLLSNIEQSLALPERMFADDVVYGLLPVYHIFGLNVMLGTTLASGASVVLVQRFDPTTALESIRKRGITVIPGVPPMWMDWAHMSGIPADSFATVRLALTGAAKMPEDGMEILRDRFGLELKEGYGLTEAAPVVSSSIGSEQRIGSVGQVVPGVRVRLVDDGGHDVLEGDPGEVWVQGPNVFMGYLDDPEATARAITPDGWLRTGDVAVADADGYLYLVDRMKDIIIVSGFNVFPAEVEDVLREHPDVVDAAVVGVAHPHSGEAVKAFVVTADTSDVDEETLVEWSHGYLARYKCPSKIVFVDELPQAATGKLLRRSLREEAGTGPQT